MFNPSSKTFTLHTAGVLSLSDGWLFNVLRSLLKGKKNLQRLITNSKQGSVILIHVILLLPIPKWLWSCKICIWQSNHFYAHSNIYVPSYQQSGLKNTELYPLHIDSEVSLAEFKEACSQASIYRIAARFLVRIYWDFQISKANDRQAGRQIDKITAISISTFHY